MFGGIFNVGNTIKRINFLRDLRQQCESNCTTEWEKGRMKFIDNIYRDEGERKSFGVLTLQ